MEADVNNAPAYLPAAVSAIAGGLWPILERVRYLGQIELLVVLRSKVWG